MMKKMYEVETTTDLLVAAQDLLKEAFKVENRDQHAEWWDNKVDILKCCNHALETGYFTGKAYDEIQEAKHTLYRAEEVAGKWFIDEDEEPMEELSAEDIAEWKYGNDYDKFMK